MNAFEKLYRELREKHGKPEGQWRLWCKRPKTSKEMEEVVIGAVLTQRVNWRNVEQAIACLNDAGICSLQDIYNLGRRNKKRLGALIKPTGFYRQKADYLFRLAEFILKNYGKLEKMKRVDSGELREQLLGLRGIGPETADSILLYALEKPTFVIDEYTKRLVKTRRLAKNFSYGFLKKLFEENIKRDYRVYQNFHALIVINEKEKAD